MTHQKLDFTQERKPESPNSESDGTIKNGEIDQPASQQWVSDAPDGGAAAWLVILGAWCTSFCSFGWINSIGIFQQYYQSGPLANYSASTIAWIPSLQIFFMMAMGPAVGKLFDSYGPRQLIFCGTLMHVFGLMMASISSQYYQFLLAQGVCSAIGVSAIFQPALSCIPGWFAKKRGIAYGITSTGSSLGGIIFPIMVSRLINSVGYGWAMRAAAFLILFLLAIANLTIRTYHPPRPSTLTKEQLASPFKEPQFLGVVAGIFLLTFGLYVPITYLTVQAIEQGMDLSLSQYLVSILNAGSLFGRLISGFASDKIGKFNTFIVCCYTSGILVLALWIPGKGNGATIVFAVLFGFFSGAYVSLIGGLVAEVSPLPEIGFRTGVVFLIGSISGLTTDPIAGAILEHGSWTSLKVFSGVFFLAGTSCILASRVAHSGWKLNVVF